MSRAQDFLLWGLLLALLTALTQLGALSQEIIHWDESTFMLIASDLADGTLPYLERFDNKPPGLFFLMAGWMSLFGDSVPSVRLLGDTCIWITAMLVFGIARNYAGPLAAGAGAALYVAVHGVEPGLFTSAGLLALPFVMGALWLILRARTRFWAMVLAGLFMGIAVLTRSNLAYVALASGLWLAGLGLFAARSSRCTWRTPVAYAIGGVIPLALVVGIYARADALFELWLASIHVPLNFVDQQDALTLVFWNAKKWLWIIGEETLVYLPFSLVTVWGALVLLWPRKAGAEEVEQGLTRHDWGIIWVFLISVFYSIFATGTIYTFYWQQFYPLICLFVPYLIQHLRPVALRALPLALVGASLIGALIPNLGESLRVLSRPGQVQSGYDVKASADFLRPLLKEGDRVWALDRHLILLYLDHPSLSRAMVHPSNITRRAIQDPLEAQGYLEGDELTRLMESAPEYLVSNTDGELFYFDWIDYEFMPYFDNYDLIHQTKTVTIWRRKGYGPSE